MLSDYSFQLTEVAITGCGFVGLLSAIEILKRRGLLHAEAARKSVHISVGFILAALPLFMDRWQVVLTNFGFFVGVVVFTGVFHIFTAVHSVKRWTIGEFLYPTSTGLVALVFSDLRIYTYAVFILAICDGVAGLAGRWWGGKGYPIWHGRKSLVGNMAFFLSALLLTTVFWTSTHGFDFAIIPIAILLSFLLTIGETLFAGGFDNVAVTFSAALVAWFILQT